MKIELNDNESAIVITDKGEIRGYVNTEIEGNTKNEEATFSTAMVSALTYLLKVHPDFGTHVIDEFDKAIQTSFIGDKKENIK
jgi:hypothetical protein